MKHIKKLNEGFITNVKNRVKNFNKFGSQMHQKSEQLIDLLKKLAQNNDNVKLIDNGLEIKSFKSDDIYTIYKDGRIIMPMGSELYIDTDRSEELYNTILKNSFDK